MDELMDSLSVVNERVYSKRDAEIAGAMMGETGGSDWKRSCKISGHF